LNIPKELRYTEQHEWIDPDGSPHRAGITDFAQSELSDIVYVELPEVGKEVSQGDACAVVESTKAASDVYAPVSGKIAEVNSDLESKPELINQDPFGEGWIFAIETGDDSETEKLMDADAYQTKLTE
jgi:glycine cleavage system H protein